MRLSEGSSEYLVPSIQYLMARERIQSGFALAVVTTESQEL
jgi:hypothetical protein